MAFEPLSRFQRLIASVTFSATSSQASKLLSTYSDFSLSLFPQGLLEQVSDK